MKFSEIVNSDKFWGPLWHSLSGMQKEKTGITNDRADNIKNIFPKSCCLVKRLVLFLDILFCFPVCYNERQCGEEGSGGSRKQKTKLYICFEVYGLICPALGPINIGRIWTCWSKVRGGYKGDQRPGALLLWRQAERIEAVQPGEDKDPGRPFISLPILEGDLQESWSRTFHKGM